MAGHLLYLEDLAEGQAFESREHSLDAGQIIAFAREFDPQAFHIDEAAAGKSFFGGLAASGWHTAALTMRLVVESVPLANGVIGGGGEIRWPNPTRAGDVLRVCTVIEEILPSRSKPGRAAIVAHCQTLNQDDEVKQDFRPKLLGWSRGAVA
jgi:acyl dehydratase